MNSSVCITSVLTIYFTAFSAESALDNKYVKLNK